MSRFIQVAPIALLAALTACTGTVAGGGAATGTSPESPPCENCEPTPDVAPAGAIATKGSPGGPDADWVYLDLGTLAPTCASPGPNSAPCTIPELYVAIGLPPALLVPGVVDLSSDAVTSYFTAQGGGYSDDSDLCPGPSGTYAGTLTIESVDATSIAFTLSGTSSVGIAGLTNADRAYVAPRCP
jgi:hypothetical protein